MHDAAETGGACRKRSAGNIAPVCAIADAGNRGAAAARQANQEIAERLEVHRSIGLAAVGLVPEAVLDFASEPEGVLSAVPGNRVAQLVVRIVQFRVVASVEAHPV